MEDTLRSRSELSESIPSERDEMNLRTITASADSSRLGCRERDGKRGGKSVPESPGFLVGDDTWTELHAS